MPSLTAWRSSETLGKFPAAWPMWKPAGGSSHGVRLPKRLMGREGSSNAILACVYVCVSLRLWLGSLSPITKWPVFTFQCGWGKVTAAFGQKQLLFTETLINYSQYVSVNISALQCGCPVLYSRLTRAIDLQWESHLCVCQFPLYDPQASNCTNMPKCHAGIPVPLTPIKTQRGTTILSSRFLLLSNLWKIYKPACCSQRSDLLKATSIIYRERKPDTNASSNKDLSRNYSLWFWADEYLLTPVNTYV